ncbi:MAG: hypothetical protein K9W44_16260 [Candidatus Lokiarchaeota archaeon]|nr:hypothetical protein [Candidatus Harpocratesius repetitus]
MAIKTKTQEMDEIEHNLNVDYLKSDFTLENVELSLYYFSKEEARDATVKLMIAAMNLNAMRLNSLKRKIYLHDFHGTGHYESKKQEIMFMNTRLYQINFRKSKDILLYSDVSINRIYRSLRDYEYLAILDDYYSVDRIRKTLGAVYRSKLRKCSVTLSDMHPYLTFHIEHAVLKQSN